MIAWTKIDSCLVWPNGKKAYLLSGNEYVRYDIASDRVDPGYPAPIEGNWPGLWSPAGAGVIWPNGKVYFLRGDEYVRYDIASDRVDPGYPAPIAGNWPGLSLSRVHAAIIWPNSKAYLFGGHLVGGFGEWGYVRWDIARDRQDDGYPASIEQNWPGLAPPIDSCVLWPNGKVYFFSGRRYSRFDIARNRVDPGYPKPIAGNWPGVPIALPDPDPVIFRAKGIFCENGDAGLVNISGALSLDQPFSAVMYTTKGHQLAGGFDTRPITLAVGDTLIFFANFGPLRIWPGNTITVIGSLLADLPNSTLTITSDDLVDVNRPKAFHLRFVKGNQSVRAQFEVELDHELMHHPRL